MPDRIHLARDENKIGYIVSNVVKTIVACQVRDVLGVARNEVVNRYHFMTLVDQPLTKMGSDKPGPAGYDNSHNVPSFGEGVMASNLTRL
jgi:hypothetical protein